MHIFAGNFDSFLGPFELRNLAKIKITGILLKQFVSATPEIAQQHLWNFVVDEDIPSTCVYS